MSERAAAAAGRHSAPRTLARLSAEFASLAVLLFITRFVALGHVVGQTDQECHIGGIAIDVLTHGVRFPLLVYAPNDYDNGSFFSGLLAALSFVVLGRNVLALKLVTHAISVAGAVATIAVLRAVLRELDVTSRLGRWTAIAALVVTIALAPRTVTFAATYAVGNHAEGSALGMILLAVFVHRLRWRSAAAGAAFWAAAGLSIYLNKGVVFVLPVLAAAELVLAGAVWRRLLPAAVGGLIGLLPELLTSVQRRGMGWTILAGKAERNAQAFPAAFVDSVLRLAEHRVALLALWVLALSAGVLLVIRTAADWRRAAAQRAIGSPTSQPAGPPLTLALAMVVGITVLHAAALLLIAQGGLGPYVIYGYPTLSVLVAVVVGLACERARARVGNGAGVATAAIATAAMLLLYWPPVQTWSVDRMLKLWRQQGGAACYWRFAEGFEREHDYGRVPRAETREQYAIARCRSFDEPAQVLDCIAGIARELNWRRGGTIDGGPPEALSPPERRTYAFGYGTHLGGETSRCDGLTDPELRRDCVDAAYLECLMFADIEVRMRSGRGLGRPRCAIGPPPMDGFWATIHADLLARPVRAVDVAGLVDDSDRCTEVLAACY